jgi:hypothetical protein
VSQGAIWLASFGSFLLVVLLYGGVFAGLLFESELAAFVALAAFFAMLAFHLGAGIFEYRRTMRREWPKVEPLTDDDEWDAA